MSNGPDGAFLLESPSEKEARERAAEQRRDRRARELQLWFNGILALFTTLTAGIVLYQNRILVRTLDEMETQSRAAMISATASKEQASAALVQATASTDAVRLAQDANKTADVSIKSTLETAHLDQRAWATFSGFTLDREPDGTTPIKVACAITNVGKTVASRTTVRTRAHMSNTPLTRPDWNSAVPDKRIWLYPNPNFRLSVDSAPFPIAQDVVKLYREGTISIYIWAYLTYDDIFGEHHWVQACAFHKFGMELGSFSFCGEGNESDQDKNQRQRARQP